MCVGVCACENMTMLTHFAFTEVPFSSKVTTHPCGSFTSLNSDWWFSSSIGCICWAHFWNVWIHTFWTMQQSLYRSKRLFKYTFYFYSVLLRKDKLSKHQHGMLGAQCQKDTNKKTSTYQCLQNQPLNFQHSFHFIPKIGLSKCHPVAKISREQLKNMKCLL